MTIVMWENSLSALIVHCQINLHHLNCMVFRTFSELWAKEIWCYPCCLQFSQLFWMYWSRLFKMPRLRSFECCMWSLSHKEVRMSVPPHTSLTPASDRCVHEMASNFLCTRIDLIQQQVTNSHNSLHHRIAGLDSTLEVQSRSSVVLSLNRTHKICNVYNFTVV